MNISKKRPFGISLIGYFYIYGAILLGVTLFTNVAQEFGIALKFGVPNVPENIMKAVVIIISLIMAYGYLKLKKWGYWFMIFYTLYFLVVSIQLSGQYKCQPFYGNAIWSIIVLIYTYKKRKYFYKKIFNTAPIVK